jgi:hypothetical protein
MAAGADDAVRGKVADIVAGDIVGVDTGAADTAVVDIVAAGILAADTGLADSAAVDTAHVELAGCTEVAVAGIRHVVGLRQLPQVRDREPISPCCPYLI